MGIIQQLFSNGLVVTETGSLHANIAVNDEKIVGILDPLMPVVAQNVIDCTDKVILPGAIDTHAHTTYKEDFYYGTMSAAKGGVTTIVEMPQSATLGNLLKRQDADIRFELIKQQAVTDVALWAGITRTTVDNIDELSQISPVGYKAFMNFAGDDYPYLDDYSIFIVMQRIKIMGSVVTVHAENEAICSQLSQRYKKEHAEPEFHEKSRPPIAELEAITRLCFFALHTGCKVNICHVSIPEAVEIVDDYCRQGADITIETCPQYLALSSKSLLKCGSFAKCNPPLRPMETVDSLWEKVRKGAIDMIGSDHSCYTEQEKSCDIWDAPGGFPGLDLFLPVLISQGVHKRNLSWERLAQITATNAAKRLGLYPRKGAIRLGSDADFAIVDPNSAKIFHGQDSFYKNPSSKFHYEGMEIKGNISMTCLRGKIVYHEGKICCQPGYGKFIKPNDK